MVRVSAHQTSGDLPYVPMGATERMPMGATEGSQRTLTGSTRHRNRVVSNLQAFYIFVHMLRPCIQVTVMSFTTYCLGRDGATRPTWCEQGSPSYGSAVAKLDAQILALLYSRRLFLLLCTKLPGGKRPLRPPNTLWGGIRSRAWLARNHG